MEPESPIEMKSSSSQSHPKWPLRLLERFCPQELYEMIEGDLLEEFEDNVIELGSAKARRRFIWHAIKFLHPYILRKRKSSRNPFMITSYLKFSLRNLAKKKVFTTINILGLSVGVAVCLVIGKYIFFESSYDRFHANGKNIYRVISSFYTGDIKDATDGYDLGPSLTANFPEIVSFARTHGNGSLVSFTWNGKEIKYHENQILFVDTSFFKIFSFKILKGNPSSTLSNSNSVVVAESVARKYFGDGNPIGRVLRLHDGWKEGLYEISAVIQDVPENSHLSFDFLLPMQALLQSGFYRDQHQRWDNFTTYVQLKEDHSVEDFNRKLPAFVDLYRGEDKGIDANAYLGLQNLYDIHYSPDLNNPGSRLMTLYVFGAIALFVLAIAWINYINLATARALERAREVGIKKAIGASRYQLITQFIVESLLVNFISVILATLIAMSLLPILNSFTGRNFELNLFEPTWLLVLAGLFVAGGLISGIYPAIVLSSFTTSEVIKGKIRDKNDGWSLRNTMVGIQFGCSLSLLVATFLIFRQVNFMQNQDKEFNTERTVIIRGPELSDAKDSEERMWSFKNELLQYPFVAKAATSFSIPGEGPGVSGGVRKLGTPAGDNRVGDVYWIDPYFMDLYDIKILSGKTWDPSIKTDFESVVINEEAVKVFDLGDNQSALNQKLILPHDTVEIMGVVKNHHWNSMKSPYSPMIFSAERISGGFMSVRLDGDIHEAMETIEAKYRSNFPDDDFHYYFLDDFYREQYHQEEVFGKLFTAFSIFAIMIGCLGLWGLATFSTLRRKKEISIRKTLGASVYSIVGLLVSQFLRPVLVAGIVVVPLASFAGRNWLEQFPYRISFSADLFLLPLAALLLVALITVLYQTLNVARSNPVDSLKGE